MWAPHLWGIVRPSRAKKSKSGNIMQFEEKPVSLTKLQCWNFMVEGLEILASPEVQLKVHKILSDIGFAYPTQIKDVVEILELGNNSQGQVFAKYGFPPGQKGKDQGHIECKFHAESDLMLREILWINTYRQGWKTEASADNFMRFSGGKPRSAGDMSMSLTREQVLAMTQELLWGFSNPYFQGKRQEVLAKKRNIEDVQALHELALTVQSRVLRKYGIEGSFEGVAQMVGEIIRFMDDDEGLRQMLRELDDKLGVLAETESHVRRTGLLTELFTKKQALSLMKELLQSYSTPDFQSKVQEWLNGRSCAPGNVPGRSRFVLAMQSKLLVKYGLPATEKKVAIWNSDAMDPFLDDWMMQQMVCVMKIKLGMELPTPADKLLDIVNTRRQPPFPISLTRDQVLALAEDLLESYNSPDFQQQLQKLAENENGKNVPGRVPLAISVQCKVLPKYGIPGTFEGIETMLLAITPFIEDSMLQTHLDAINEACGFPKNSTAWGLVHPSRAFRSIPNNSTDKFNAEDPKVSFEEQDVVKPERQISGFSEASTVDTSSSPQGLGPHQPWGSSFVEADTILKAEEETRAKAEEEAQAKRQAEEEAQVKAKEDARIKAEEEARLKAKVEERIKAEAEAKAKAEEEARLKASVLMEEAQAERLHRLRERLRNAEVKASEADVAVEQALKRQEAAKAHVETVKQELQDAELAATRASPELLVQAESVLSSRQQADSPPEGLTAAMQSLLAAVTARANRQAEEEAQVKAKEDARMKAEEEGTLKAKEEERIKAEEEAKLKVQEEARLKAEGEARRKAEEEARLKAGEEATIKLEEEARLKAAEVARAKAEEQAMRHPNKDDWMSRVRADPRSLKNAPPSIRADRAVIEAAAMKDGSSLKHASPDLRVDHGFLLPVVHKNGWALRHLPAHIQADRSIVLAAVQSCGQVLRYASTELKADTELALAAIGQDARAAMHASPKLFTNPAFVESALTANHKVSPYIASLRCRLGSDMV